MLTAVLHNALYKKPLIISRDEQVTPLWNFPPQFSLCVCVWGGGGGEKETTVVINLRCMCVMRKIKKFKIIGFESQ
jgi:hypothetical protein